MPRLFENDNQYFFEPTEGTSFLLNENNLFANLHRETKFMDRIGIQDPTDQEWWTWFRADQPPEIFDQMVEVAAAIGTVLLRSTPFEEIEAQFDKRHAVTDDEIQGFFDGS